MFELHHLSATEQWDWLQRGEVSPRELTAHYLDRIARFNESLGAFTTVTAELALKRADALERAGRTIAPLWGIPVGDKDLSRRAGVRTTFGSAAFADFVPDESDPIVEAIDALGAVSLGKTNAPEFGMPAYTESAVAPAARTPYNLDLGAGGSSGGAAVAVAAGLLPVAPGSDGGGSIRIPAAACGLVGLKPSRGLVPTGSGLLSLGGLVTAGPIARSVADAAMLLDALLGERPFAHATQAPRWEGGGLLNAAVRGEGRFQVGVMTTSPWDEFTDIQVSLEARAALDLAIAELSAMGHGIDAAELPPSADYPEHFTTLWQAGASTIPVEDVAALEPLTQWLVTAGRQLSARALAESLAALGAFESRVIRAFSGFDAVMTPTLAITPRPVGWFDHENPQRNFEQQVQFTPWTSFVNVAGLPAITLPVHVTEDGIPMGVQLIGRPGGEHVLLSLGAQLERRLQWQRRHPSQW